MSLLGKKIRDYVIESFVGEGGMGVVYKVVGRKRQDIKAIKFMRRAPHLELETRRFIQEARVGKRLIHPNLVQIFDLGKLKSNSDYSHFMIMEFVNGSSLKEKHNLSMLRIIEIITEICQGLNFIHKANLVHRDLKPSNILLSQDGHAKISDFGVVKLEADTQFTKTGAIVGTPAYMSPEQCKDASRVDHRSDIYALGIVLFELFAGTLPFKGPSDYNFIIQHSLEPPPPLSDFAPDMPSLLYVMVQRMLEKEPKKRYQSVSDILSDLKKISSEMLGSSSGGNNEIIICSSPQEIPTRTTLPQHEITKTQEMKISRKTINDKTMEMKFSKTRKVSGRRKKVTNKRLPTQKTRTESDKNTTTNRNSGRHRTLSDSQVKRMAPTSLIKKESKPPARGKSKRVPKRSLHKTVEKPIEKTVEKPEENDNKKKKKYWPFSGNH